MSRFHVDVRLEHAGAGFDRFVLEASFRSHGNTTVLFGPSGSGKSSLLQAILGACRPGRGAIRVAGRTVYDSERGIDLPTRRRGIGIVFQDALLFPHLDARHNVAFGVHGSDRYAVAQHFLERVDGGHLGSRRVAGLSGGERQRIALARALAARPRAVLLDEPFSSLDAPARESLADALRQVQGETGIPLLFVTHDIGEALRIGDHMVVLDRGRVVQQGHPAEVVSKPTAAAAARAVGTENMYLGRVIHHHAAEGYTTLDLGGTRVETGLLPVPAGETIAVCLRAEDVLLSTRSVPGTSARNVLEGTVAELARRGTAVEVRVNTPVPIRALITPASVTELELRPGMTIYLLIKAAAFRRLV